MNGAGIADRIALLAHEVSSTRERYDFTIN